MQGDRKHLLEDFLFASFGSEFPSLLHYIQPILPDKKSGLVPTADTLAYAERLKSQGRTVAEMGDPNLAAVQGGLVVVHPGTGAIMGGIGVSGLTAQEDEDIARLGLQTLGL